MQRVSNTMKVPFESTDPATGRAVFRCRPCATYKNADQFFNSDLKYHRASCKTCTYARSTESRQGDKTRLVLSRFKLWSRRNQHPEAVNFEISDVASIIGASDLDQVVLRPTNFNKRCWIPSDLRCVSIKQSRLKEAPQDIHETSEDGRCGVVRRVLFLQVT